MTAKTLYSGTTHNVGGANGFTKSADGSLDLQLAAPHPAAENLFGAAWSACFIAAIGAAAAETDDGVNAFTATPDILVGVYFHKQAAPDVTAFYIGNF